MAGSLFSDPGALSALKCEEPRQRIPSGTAVNTAIKFGCMAALFSYPAIRERLLGKLGATMYGSSPISGAKNWRHAMPSAARAVLRQTGSHCALRQSSTMSWTACRVPSILSPPALPLQTSTKQSGLGLRGGRRTSLARCRGLDFLCFAVEIERTLGS